MATFPALYSSYAALQLNSRGPNKEQHHSKPDPTRLEAQTRSDLVHNGRLCDVTQTWISDDDPGECELTGQIAAAKDATSRRFGSYSLLLRRNVYPYAQDRTPKAQLEIQSEALQAVIRGVASHVRTVNVQSNPIIIKAPYHELYHFRHEIEAAGAKAVSKLSLSAQATQLETELKALSDFIDEHLGDIIMESESLMSQRLITMEYLWAIYKPGEMVLLNRQEEGGNLETCSGVVQSYFVKKKIDGSTMCVVNMRIMSFDNGRFGVVEQNVPFAPFSGEMVDITILPVYPLKYSTDPKRVVRRLVERGKTFIDLCRTEGGKQAPRHLVYHGPLWMQRERWKEDGCEFFDAPERMISGRVMVDPEGYLSEHSVFRKRIIGSSLSKAMAPSGISQSDYDSSEDHSLEEDAPDDLAEVDLSSLTVEELMSFPSRIGGYSLVTKDAGFFRVENFGPIVWEEERANQLRHSSHKMRSVLRIARGFSFNSKQFNYKIENKGRGLVVLLFGLSGSGKTLTAECVAEALHLPLYRVSGSDFGAKKWEAELSIIRAFDRATRWGAILLFDEADAFMARRNDDSLERNAMVSTLLRLLEYQTGIIILTTNRKKDFDPAFQSRIHVSIEYGKLTAAEKEGIWRWELDNIGRGPHVLSEQDFEKLGQLDLDGRTIKNVVHVLKLFMQGESRSSVSLSDVKEILEIATGNIQEEGRRQLEEFCRDKS